MTTGRYRVRAFAKINLTLRILGALPDGYHELRTIFQSLSLHDTLEVHPSPGPFRIECTDPACPTDARNLVWKAAARLWTACGRRGDPRGLTVRLVKRIPMEAGLGGGSSDAVAALRACAAAWGFEPSARVLPGIAADLGADCAYFLQGGTALGLGRGDELFAVPDCAPAWVVLVRPSFGVSTKEAYGWLDADRASGLRGRPASARRSRARACAAAFGLRIPDGELINDLEAPVVARRPEVGRLVRALARHGARMAAMSGSGSAVFGIFGNRQLAEAVAEGLARRGRLVEVARTLGRQAFEVRSRVEALGGRGLPPSRPVV